MIHARNPLLATLTVAVVLAQGTTIAAAQGRG